MCRLVIKLKSKTNSVQTIYHFVHVGSHSSTAEDSSLLECDTTLFSESSNNTTNQRDFTRVWWKNVMALDIPIHCIKTDTSLE
jgi:hypothetical protein